MMFVTCACLIISVRQKIQGWCCVSKYRLMISKLSVSAVGNAGLDWPGSSALVPDVDSLCCQGVCTFHFHCLHQESLMPGLYL